MENDTRKINILLVDDNPKNLTALESILHAPDRNLVRASSGNEALRYLLDHDAAVVLLDVHMPVIDGLETAALIRGRERLRNIPIIFLTAFDDANNSRLSKGYSLGAVDYIIKPFDPEALKSKVGVFVELFKKTEQIKRQAELLRKKNLELEQSNLQRLAKLIDLGQELAAERDPEQLLQKFCHAARDIIGACYAALGVLNEESLELHHFLASGFDVGKAKREGLPHAIQNFLFTRLSDRPALRLSCVNQSEQGIPSFNNLTINSVLGVVIQQQGKICGWLYLADKANGSEFSEADERFAVTLSQAIVFYENARLYAESKRHAITLEQEIAERKQAEEARAQLLIREQIARTEAEAANRAKDEFLAVVSHELRTPLNAILGWARLLSSARLDTATTTKAIATIERNVLAQSRLIDDLLDVSGIIRGKFQLETGPVDLTSVISAALESVRPAAEAKGIEFQVRLDPGIETISGDAYRLQQVIWNLLANAIKFTPQGRVEVQLKRLEDEVEIAIHDTGQGIDPDFLPHIFERFRQADSTSTRKHGGLGLGLAIVRQLVEMHGGSITAESSGIGRGATFKVRLPLSKNHGKEAQNAAKETAAVQLSHSAPLIQQPMLTGLRVLVVDDETTSRDMVSFILTQHDALVVSAASCNEALEAFKTFCPDVLVSDLAMPGEDGYMLIRQVRALESSLGTRMPAVALTAYAKIEDRLSALAAGFQMHVPKPVEPDELVAVVASLAGRMNHLEKPHHNAG